MRPSAGRHRSSTAADSPHWTVRVECASIIAGQQRPVRLGIVPTDCVAAVDGWVGLYRTRVRRQRTVAIGIVPTDYMTIILEDYFGLFWLLWQRFQGAPLSVPRVPSTQSTQGTQSTRTFALPFRARAPTASTEHCRAAWPGWRARAC